MGSSRLLRWWRRVRANKEEDASFAVEIGVRRGRKGRDLADSSPFYRSFNLSSPFSSKKQNPIRAKVSRLVGNNLKDRRVGFVAGTLCLWQLSYYPSPSLLSVTCRKFRPRILVDLLFSFWSKARKGGTTGQIWLWNLCSIRLFWDRQKEVG